MGQISTPPRPASRYWVSRRVRLVLSTALPSHHQRVHGRFSRVGVGHWSSGGNGACGSPANTEPEMSKSERAKRLFPAAFDCYCRSCSIGLVISMLFFGVFFGQQTFG